MQKFLAPVLIIFFISFSLSPTIYEWNNRGRIKPNRSFELVHNFPTDYNFYLSRIRQGKEGAWLAVEKYTSEPHLPSMSQVFYVLIGRFSDLAHMQTPYVWLAYHLSRIFFAILFLYLVWRLVSWVFGSVFFSTIAFLLVVTASTWPKFEMVDGWPRLGGYMPWYSVMDSLQRITFLPHVLLGQSLLLFILWVMAGGFVSKKHPANYLFLGVVGIILGVVFPPALLFIYGVFLLSRKDLIAKAIFFVMTVPTVLYWSLTFAQYPWKRLVEFDILHPTQFSYWEYILAVGPVLPLGLAGLLLVLLRSGDKLRSKLLPMVYWVLAWITFMVIFNFIPQQSPTRFTQMLPHVPLGILTAYFFFTLMRKIIWAPVVLIVLGLSVMASSFMWQKDFVDHKLRADYPLVPHGAEVMYPLKNIITTLDWLQINTPRTSVVLSGITTGNYIPVYSGNTVYIGHANTVRLEDKEQEVARFYRGLYKKDAISWIQSRGVEYIFYGPEERELAGGITDLRVVYPQLREVFSQNGVSIYAL